MKQLIIIAALALSACGSSVVRDRPATLKVPVAQPCATARPTQPLPLKTAYPDSQWGGMDVRQKAAAVGKQALDWQTYGEQINAATAACPEVKGN